jgi:ABC-type Fe3+/spermidine/putrescine transport system ATPase subunit
MQGWPQQEISARVREMLQLVELSGYERRRVSELSGGEQQRVALARSLAPRPRLLMFDEPLGSLDRALREQLMNSLRGILKQVGVTALYVTHDQEEAFAIADRVFIMQPGAAEGEGGRIVQGGTPQEVYCQPRSAYVAGFLGFRNLLPGTVIADDDNANTVQGAANAVHSAVDGEPLSRQPCTTARARIAVETAIGTFAAAAGITESIAAGDQVTLLIRPEAADILPAGASSDTPNTVPGHLLSSSFRGSSYLIQTEHAGGVVLTSEVPATGAEIPPNGSPLLLHLNPAALSLLRR